MMQHPPNQGSMMNDYVGMLASVLVFALLTVPAAAQAPPVVGVMTAQYKPMSETTEINGRIQAIARVDLVARVTAFLTEQHFVEGTEVKKDDLLYSLERAPFEADVEAKQAAVAQAEAQLENANIALSRASELAERAVGTQVTLDNARATQRTAAAQLKAAQAQLHQSQINLGYTEIRSPINGRIGRTSVTIGNVVSPTSGVLATIVGPDPVYVVFPVAMRRVLELRERYASKGGFDAVKLLVRLPNGKMYDQIGKLDFVDISVAKDTDTLTLRGTIPNPFLPTEAARGVRFRELADNEFVTVILEAVVPLKVLAVPRAAILSDQQGDYLYIVNAKNVVEQRRVTIGLGQSTPEIATITNGLTEGERVIVEGIQRARPNLTVTATPVTSPVMQR
jgi:membrane fusion protein (multidrug efflux system)